MSMEILKEHKSMFGINFDENKQVLNKVSTITSKMLKNELAGYITKFIKNELKNKTELVENEEESSEDLESSKDDSKCEVVLEESSKDESKSKVMDSSTAEL